MSSIQQATNEPDMLEIGGKQYKIGALEVGDLGKIEAFIRQKKIKAVQTALGNMGGDVLRAGFDVAVNSPIDVFRSLDDGDNLLYAFYVLVSKYDDSLTYEQFRGEVTDEEFEAFTALLNARVPKGDSKNLQGAKE